MRKLHLIQVAFICFVSFIIFSSCKKNNIANTPQVKCKLVTATDNAGHITNTFLYDSSNRLITINHVSDYDPYTKHLYYKGDSIISYIDAGVNSSTDTIVLNSFGLIASNRQVTSGGVQASIYNYDANGILMSSSNGATTVDYTFINGDNVYQRYNSSGNLAIDTLSYYTDKPSVPVDYFSYTQFLYNGAYCYVNKHLLKSYQAGPNQGQYTYDFDTNGNVITLYSNFGMGKDTLHFTYACP